MKKQREIEETFSREKPTNNCIFKRSIFNCSRFMRFLVYTLAFFSVFVSVGCKKQISHKTVTSISDKTRLSGNQMYRLRKYTHVKKLYQRLAAPVTKLCLQHKVPPGAVLSILSLESGWGRGYVGQITGNFLSLNAVGKDAELPALYLPSKNEKPSEVLFDSVEISRIPPNKITWKLRPASLKKDYRPSPYAGTGKNLAYFKNHPDRFTRANLKNVEDFVQRFISSKSSIAAYKEARLYLETAISKHGIAILFDQELNEKFINTIGGRPNSYNYRETWPKKVISIMEGVGAIDLCQKLHNNTPFETAWGH